MRTIIRLALGSFLFVTLFASTSMAQVQRTFVSGLGDDSNPCSRTSPCRTISHALTGTNAGGEVIVLDSAGYGPFSITQSVSIIAPPGVYAGISVFSGAGVTINAGGSDTVILRGLTVNNQGTSSSGIVFHTGATLHIEGCVVNGFSTFPSSGVFFDGPGELEVKDSIMRGNSNGIFILGSSGTDALAAIDQVRLEGNTIGLFVREASQVTVRNSIASDNAGDGFRAQSVTSAAVELNIENCVASNNGGAGVFSVSSSTGVATVRVSNSTLTDNGLGMNNFGSPAVLLSRGNNTVEGNATNTLGTIGSYAAK